MPEISIIVPVYNVEKYLPRCIDSILAQTFTDFELILIDDGSPDNCGKICDEYAGKDDRIIVIHKKNAGVSAARNDGLDVASGKYISFVDSDDIIHPQFYKVMRETINDADLAYCKYARFDEEYNFENIEKIKHFEYENGNKFSQPDLTIYMVWNKLIKKDIISDLRFDTALKNAEDSLFAFNTMMKCSKVVYVNEVLYGYFVRNTGAVGSIDFKGRNDIVNVWKHIHTVANDNNYSVLKKFSKWCLIDSNIGLFYSSDNAKSKNESRKFLISNLLTLMFGNTRLNNKEKIALLFNLFFN